ncbi:hypothetical protein NIASO_06220 [Niabella soli DSM 19437]|uniref:Uncharacterized protein n=1 Tax=Niabella soli DSM 19437 TaxID=929713 RepID=W0F2X0_9BACT|nr:hypothetical protein NIASO_06220 [Niabella soli DSM 19437]
MKMKKLNYKNSFIEGRSRNSKRKIKQNGDFDAEKRFPKHKNCRKTA